MTDLSSLTDEAVLRNLDEGETITSHIKVQKRSGKAQKVVVFWL